jgi:basic amino acid/polyamine antiporter, APA family
MLGAANGSNRACRLTSMTCRSNVAGEGIPPPSSLLPPGPMDHMRTSSSTAPSTSEGLVRGIRRWDLVALVLNAIIGAGIFGLPARVYALAGVWSLVAYLVCAAVVVLIILCFAEVSSRYGTTGGPYLYAHEAFGAFAGFEMGWLLWLARLTAFAALCNLWLEYAGLFVPGVATGAGRVATITLIVLVLTVLNVRGVRVSTLFNDTFTLAKLAPLVVFVLVGLFFIEPANLTYEALPSAGSFSAAVLLLVFAFSGFEMTVIPAGEARDPQRHAPFALFVGIAFIVGLYMMIQFVSMGTLAGLGDSSRPLADAAAGFMGTPGAVLLSAGALISITGTLNVIVLVGPRLPFAMAERGQLPKMFAATHPRYRTPHVAIIASALVMLVLTLQGSFVGALTVSTVIRLVTYAATCAALPVLRRREGVEAPAFRAPGGTLTAVVAIALCGWLISSSSWTDIGVTILAAGAGVLLYLAVRVGTPSSNAKHFAGRR